MLNLAKSRGKSIGDLFVQLDHLCNELQEFGLTGKLNACKTVRDASNIMLFVFEKPYDTGTQVQNARANWSQGYYDKYAGSAPAPGATVPTASGQKYAVLAGKTFIDKSSAMNQLSDLQRNGFNGMVVTIEG